jgi:hypothetical protein
MLKLAKRDDGGSLFTCLRTRVKQLLGAIDRIENVLPAGFIIGIEQFNIEAGEVLLGRIRFVRRDNLVMRKGLSLHSPPRALDHTESVG